MSSIIVDLIILPIAGVIGGNAIGKSLPKYDLGLIGNTIAGAIGGVAGGQMVVMILGLIGVAGGAVSAGSIIGPLVGGGACGAILTIMVNVFKSRMANE
jgi:hypothetical protein